MLNQDYRRSHDIIFVQKLLSIPNMALMHRPKYTYICIVYTYMYERDGERERAHILGLYPLLAGWGCLVLGGGVLSSGPYIFFDSDHRAG